MGPTIPNRLDTPLHKLEQVMPIWDDKQAPYRPTSGPLLSTYICTYVSDVIKYHMRKDIRESVGLGSPPTQFTTKLMLPNPSMHVLKGNRITKNANGPDSISL